MPDCYDNNIDNETLEYLRCQAKNVSNCDNLAENIDMKYYCSENITMDVFYPTVVDPSSDDSKCCGLTLSRFYLILFLSIGAFILALVVGIMVKLGTFKKIYGKCRKKKKEEEVKETNDASSEASSEQYIIDPDNKYKEAENSGIKIYHEAQFGIWYYLLFNNL